jgi:hypothetical protein
MGCLGAIVLLAVALVLAARFAVNPARPLPFERDIRIDEDSLRKHVGRIASTTDFRSFEHPDVLDRAASYIRGYWQSVGFDVVEQAFEVGGVSYRNLIAGYGPDQAPLVVVGAHYDVCGDQPGADDNASAVAALLELARLLATDRPEVGRRIELVAYSLEEPPFYRTPDMGSWVHASGLRDRDARVVAMMCLEMVGYFSDRPGSQKFPLPGLGLLYPRAGDFIAVVGNLSGRGLTRNVKAAMAGACTVPVHSINAPALVPGLDFSDHWSYWKHGFEAVMVTDTAFYRNPHYHLPSDRPETLDYRRLAQVVRGVYAATLALAGSESR